MCCLKKEIRDRKRYMKNYKELEEYRKMQQGKLSTKHGEETTNIY